MNPLRTLALIALLAFAIEASSLRNNGALKLLHHTPPTQLTHPRSTTTTSTPHHPTPPRPRGQRRGVKWAWQAARRAGRYA